MPSNDHQVTAWILAIFTPIYLIGKLLGWLGEVLAYPWFVAKTTVISIIDSHYSTMGEFGYVLLIFLFAFPFVTKSVFKNPHSKISALAMWIPVISFTVFVVMNWSYYSHNFGRWMGDETIGWINLYRFNVVTALVLTPLLGGMAFVFISIHAALFMAKTIMITIAAVRAFVVDSYNTTLNIIRAIAHAFGWLQSRFSAQDRQRWKQKQERENQKRKRDDEEARYQKERASRDDFDASRFKKSQPYGWEKYSDTELKILGLALDPNAPEPERESALKRLMKITNAKKENNATA